MSKAWIYQKHDDVEKLGEVQAPWLVGWLEPDGRRRSKTTGPGPGGKRTAQRLASKLTSELMTGTYQQKLNVPWDQFVTEYDNRILGGLDPRTRRVALDSLGHFARLMRPARVFGIDTDTIDRFTERRRVEPGKKRQSVISAATVNKDLRHVRAALVVAHDWGYLPKVPRFRMERQVKKLVRYVTPEHFAAVYAACDAATHPAGLPYPAADWWRALLVFGYMTGWRISDMLALRREDLDLKAHTAVTRGEDNKGGRDDVVRLAPVVVEHLLPLASFEPMVFPWRLTVFPLYAQFHKIQEHAGIRLVCRERHEHTPSCFLYGFHDLRRAFASVNASRMTADALQKLMRHKSYQTTQVYIDVARQIDDAVANLYVPEFLRKKDA